jgi:hypothetical protein
MFGDEASDRAPGDFGLRLGYPEGEQQQRDMQLKELRNGRLAMLAFGGMVTAGTLTESTFPFFAVADKSARKSQQAWALCGASSSSASQASLIVRQAKPTSSSMPFLPKPMNLGGLPGAEVEFDPLGFSDTFDVRWLREAELKHGRVCMLATLGFAAEQFVTFPGLEGTGSANALQAIWTAPASATASLILLAGYIESSSYDGKLTMLDMFGDEASDRAPGDLNFGTKFLAGKTEEETTDLKLKELNNGRLAMLAFSGMVHHNLVVNGPLFPLVPENWAGPQGSWKIESLAGWMSS